MRIDLEFSGAMTERVENLFDDENRKKLYGSASSEIKLKVVLSLIGK